jgi:hypothetical protein
LNILLLSGSKDAQQNLFARIITKHEIDATELTPSSWIWHLCGERERFLKLFVHRYAALMDGHRIASFVVSIFIIIIIARLFLLNLFEKLIPVSLRRL